MNRFILVQLTLHVTRLDRSLHHRVQRRVNLDYLLFCASTNLILYDFEAGLPSEHFFDWAIAIAHSQSLIQKLLILHQLIVEIGKAYSQSHIKLSDFAIRRFELLLYIDRDQRVRIFLFKRMGCELLNESVNEVLGDIRFQICDAEHDCIQLEVVLLCCARVFEVNQCLV